MGAHPPLSSITLLAALGFALVADSLFWATWFPPYFRTGIPMYSRSFPAKPASDWPIPAHELQDVFSSLLTYSMGFRALTETQYAFRERLQIKPVRYIPLMHGLVSWNYQASRLHITGYANWFPIIFLITASIGSVISFLEGAPFALVVLAGLLVIIALSYAFQAHSYSQIGKYAARRWSELQVAYGADA